MEATVFFIQIERDAIENKKIMN